VERKTTIKDERTVLNSVIKILLFSILICRPINSQTFTRSVLATKLNFPWEITYGPDGFLWVSEAEGTISRVDPNTGDRTIVYQADDYFGGDPSESAPCGRVIGGNTYGLALHPDFLNNPLVYLYYSYNAGTVDTPHTLFKIVELTWDPQNETIDSSKDIVTGLPNGYDHWGGRMIAITQNGKDYLYFSVGDLGAEDLSCYDSPEDNPNNYTQDPNTKNGKIHRVYLDGTIPDDNPIPGNSFFTRGHRNPQGLVYNPDKDILYDIEHGAETDDEINVLHAGYNYGWQNVRGYAYDNNYPGELDYANNYVHNSLVPNDSLMDPMYSWGAESQPPENSSFLQWPTVAPSDGIYYNSDGIPEWKNSILVVTLKDGVTTDEVVYQVKLNPDGLSLAPSTDEDPNPKPYFADDERQNGRLRDIAISPDGKKLFLINNNWTPNDDEIVEYTYVQSFTDVKSEDASQKKSFNIKFYISSNNLNIQSNENIKRVEIYNILGQRVKVETGNINHVNIGNFARGFYIFRAVSVYDESIAKKFIR
jgi:aldose sugar dehydrogenase